MQKIKVTIKKFIILNNNKSIKKTSLLASKFTNNLQQKKIQFKSQFAPTKENNLCVPLFVSQPVITPHKTEELKLSAQAQGAYAACDEINKFIKKITLNFSLQKNESSFFIKEGLFEGARFYMNCNHQKLALRADFLSENSRQLLKKNAYYLHKRLAHKGIILTSFVVNT
jgi:hypothetical protein